MGLAMEPSLDLVLILSSHWYMIQEIGARPLATMQILTHGKRAESIDLRFFDNNVPLRISDIASSVLSVCCYVRPSFYGAWP